MSNFRQSNKMIVMYGFYSMIKQIVVHTTNFYGKLLMLCAQQSNVVATIKGAIMVESNQLGDLLIVVYKNLKTKIEKDLKQYDIGMGQLQILMVFFSVKKPMTQNELVKTLEIDKANISRSVGRLVSKGFLILNEEGRSYALSDLGHQLKSEIGATFSNINTLMTRPISQEGIKANVETLTMIQKNLKDNV